MTMILKIRVWMLISNEEALRSTEDVRLAAASVLLLARLRLALWKSMEDVRMVTLSSARVLRAIPLPPAPPPPPGARVSSGESLVIMPEEAMRKSVCVCGEERGWTGGWMSEGRRRKEEGGGDQRCNNSDALDQRLVMALKEKSIQTETVRKQKVASSFVAISVMVVISIK